MCECYAVISENDPRAEVWQQVVEDLRVPLKHPLPVLMDGPEGQMRFYEGDPTRLFQRQWTKLCVLMNEKFGVPKRQVLLDLRAGNLPIKADGCTTIWCSHHSRLAL